MTELRSGKQRNGLLLPQGKKFVFSKESKPIMEPTQHNIQWIPGANSVREKQSVNKASYCLPSNVEFKNDWKYSFNQSLMSQYLIKQL